MLVGLILLRIGIVEPFAIDDEFVTVASRLKSERRLPMPIFSKLHGCGIRLPVIELAADGNLSGARGKEGKADRDRLGASRRCFVGWVRRRRLVLRLGWGRDYAERVSWQYWGERVIRLFVWFLTGHAFLS